MAERNFKCSLCGGVFRQGDEHIHLGQIRVFSETWTGRRRYQNESLRLSNTLSAKIGVWLRFKAKDVLCRLAGGHYLNLPSYQCELCFLTGEELEDMRGQSLRKALRWEWVAVHG